MGCTTGLLPVTKPFLKSLLCEIKRISSVFYSNKRVDAQDALLTHQAYYQGVYTSTTPAQKASSSPFVLAFLRGYL